MRFLLTLECNKFPAFLPFNYQYPLSAAIYKIIQKADSDYAAFLHDAGYGEGFKNFKLFTFSDIITPFKRNGDRMQLLSNSAKLQVCFFLPAAAENFIKGLFMDQELEIVERGTRVNFQVARVENIPDRLPNDPYSSVILQPLSPIVTGIKNEKGNYSYLDPGHTLYGHYILQNLLQKYKAIHKTDDDELQRLEEQLKLKVLFFSNPPQQRLITIKAGTAQETKIKGFKKFRLQLNAPKELLEIALCAGVGLYNAQGMGCVQIIDNI